MTRVIVLFLSFLGLSSCAPVLRRPEPGIQIQEQVELCFRMSEEGHILASLEPANCYSMRCTHTDQTTGTALVDRAGHQLEFEATFTLSETKPLLGGCGVDCAGGGRIDFDLGMLEVGLYSVKFRDEEVGELSITSGLPWRDQCIP